MAASSRLNPDHTMASMQKEQSLSTVIRLLFVALPILIYGSFVWPDAEKSG